MINFILLVSLALFAGFAFADILIARKKITGKLRECHIAGVDSDQHLKGIANAMRYNPNSELYFCLLCQHHFLYGVTSCNCRKNAG